MLKLAGSNQLDFVSLSRDTAVLSPGAYVLRLSSNLRASFIHSPVVTLPYSDRWCDLR
jgi:hypothetical protein